MTMQVREVRDRDAREVAALLSELGYPTDEAAAAKRLRAQHEHVLVADDDGRVVGLASLATLHTLTRARPTGRLTALGGKIRPTIGGHHTSEGCVSSAESSRTFHSIPPRPYAVTLPEANVPRLCSERGSRLQEDRQQR